MIPASISIDIDPISCYADIYGFSAGSESVAEEMEIMVNTWLRVLRRYQVRATFFFVASSLDSPALIQSVLAQGHEVGNHTLSHPYNLSRLPMADLYAEIVGAHERLAAYGARPVGFRAPGYHLCPGAVQVCDELGYTYSSSQLASWSYMTAKIVARWLIAMRGGRSKSVIHSVQDLRTPPHPYLPDGTTPWRPAGSDQKTRLMELPITCGAAPLRLPATGAFLFMTGSPALIMPHKRYPAVLNFHGLDLWPDDVALPYPLREREIPLRYVLPTRITLVEKVIGYCRAKGWALMPLRSMASAWKR